MIRAAMIPGVLAALLAPALAVGAHEITVPSGQPVTLHESLLDENPGALWLRLRFVAPEMDASALDHDALAADMDHLCDHVAIPVIARDGLAAERIVVSLAARELAFGVSDPDVRQVFAQYRPENGRCIWEEF